MKYVLILAGLFAVICSSPQMSDPDPRRDQIAACQAAIKTRIGPGPLVTFPSYADSPERFTRGENNAFEPIETFPFAVRGQGVFGAYCAYGADGRLAAADIEGL